MCHFICLPLYVCVYTFASHFAACQLNQRKTNTRDVRWSSVALLIFFAHWHTSTRVTRFASLSLSFTLFLCTRWCMKRMKRKQKKAETARHMQRVCVWEREREREFDTRDTVRRTIDRFDGTVTFTLLVVCVCGCYLCQWCCCFCCIPLVRKEKREEKREKRREEKRREEEEEV